MWQDVPPGQPPTPIIIDEREKETQGYILSLHTLPAPVPPPVTADNGGASGHGEWIECGKMYLQDIHPPPSP